MESGAAPAAAHTGALDGSSRVITGGRVRALAAWGLPFGLVLYLALHGGGYDATIHQGVGIAAWLALLLGVAAGALPVRALGREAWLLLGLLAAFVAWTGLSVIWSESVERSIDSFTLLATYLGIFALASLAAGRETLHRNLSAVGAAISVVALLALLSRLHPAWFPENTAAEFLPAVQARLNYPLDSWNGLAGLMAIGLPLVLAFATEGRRLATKAVACAALPLIVLVLFYTLSRGGAVAAGVGALAFLALHPRRLNALPTLALAALASGLALLAAAQRGALKDGLTTAVAADQGDQMLWIVVALCAAVALLRIALAVAERRELLSLPEISQQTARRLAIGASVVAFAAVVALAFSGQISSTWEEFKQSGDPTTTAGRLESASGNGRYQYWESSVEAMKTAPLTGIGAGTFEYWWAREGTIFGFTKYVHSLYFETLAELGLVGLALIVALLASVLAIGARCLRRSRSEQRHLVAAAIAATAAFGVAVGIDWGWVLPVIPVSFLLIAAFASPSGNGPGRDEAADGASGPRAAARPGFPLTARIGFATGAMAVLILLSTSLIGDRLIEKSRAEARAQDLGAALDAAESAERLQPYAATPHLQQALVLELQGDLDAASWEASQAIEKNLYDWKPRYILARIEKQRGNIRDAKFYYGQAHSVSPRSPIFVDHPNRELP